MRWFLHVLAFTVKLMVGHRSLALLTGNFRGPCVRRSIAKTKCLLTDALWESKSQKSGHTSTSFSESPEDQWAATQSHIEMFIIPLEAAGYTVDVFSATYDCKWYGELMAKFGSRLKQAVLTKMPGSQQLNTAQAIGAVSKAHKDNPYLWVVVFRNDMIFKANLGQILIDRNPSGKFLWPFRLTAALRQFGHRVPDTLQVFDAKYLGLFATVISAVWPLGSIWANMEGLPDYPPEEVFGYVSDEFAEPTSHVMSNTLYKLAGQTEGPVAPQNFVTQR